MLLGVRTAKLLFRNFQSTVPVVEFFEMMMKVRNVPASQSVIKQ